MRKLFRPQEPYSLKSISKQLKKESVSLMLSVGGYPKLSEADKSRLWNKFKGSSGIEKIKAMSNKKCAYCECQIEVSSYIELDHFYPQSLYPSAAYSWKNLLPCCSRCNKAKTDWDTKLLPIINPAKIDPRFFLTFRGVYPLPLSNLNTVDTLIATRTISVLKLDRSALLRARQPLYNAIIEFEISLQERLEQRNKTATPKYEINEIDVSIASSLNVIKNMLNDDNQFSGWLKIIIDESIIIQKASQVSRFSFL